MLLIVVVVHVAMWVVGWSSGTHAQENQTFPYIPVTDKTCQGTNMIPAAGSDTSKHVKCTVLCNSNVNCTALAWNWVQGRCDLKYNCTIHSPLVDSAGTTLYIKNVDTVSCHECYWYEPNDRYVIDRNLAAGRGRQVDCIDEHDDSPFIKSHHQCSHCTKTSVYTSQDQLVYVHRGCDSRISGSEGDDACVDEKHSVTTSNNTDVYFFTKCHCRGTYCNDSRHVRPTTLLLVLMSLTSILKLNS